MFKEFKHFVAYGAVLAVLAASAVPSAAGDDADMMTVANGFYSVYATFHPSDGIPSDAARAKYAPYITPALDHLLAKAEAAQKSFAKEHKSAPPLIEGDLFSSLFEGATAYKVRSCDAQSATCTVDLTNMGAKDKPVHWTDTLDLTKTAQGWRINDISYGGNWDFANRGRLTQTLHMVISDMAS